MKKQNINKTNIILALVLFFLTQKAMSQQATSAASGSAIIEEISFEYIIGEMVLVNTASTASVILTQGFLQPINENPTSVSARSYSSLSFNCYPNPVHNMLTLSATNFIDERLEIRITDILGRSVALENMEFNALTDKHIDVSSYKAGCYFLNILNKESQNIVETFKIIKY